MGPSFRIRAAVADDLGELITLQRAAFLAEAHIYGHPRLPPMQETVEQARQVLADPGVQVFVAEVDQPRPRIVGCVRAKPIGAITDVGRLATAPDLLGHGIGSRLLQHVHDHPAPTTEEFELFTGSRSTGNHRLYAAHGYLPARTFVDSEGIEVIVMRRPVLLNVADRPRPRVCAYVLDRDDLLVFEHRDVAAGVQVPAGGIRTGESVRMAAEREVREETGLAVRFSRLLGYSDTPHPQTGATRLTAFVTASLVDERSESVWEHAVDSRDGDAGLTFHCRFAPLQTTHLAEDQRAFLSAVSRPTTD